LCIARECISAQTKRNGTQHTLKAVVRERKLIAPPAAAAADEIPGLKELMYAAQPEYHHHNVCAALAAHLIKIHWTESNYNCDAQELSPSKAF
jgi:hypothetical protein